jgi:hypothetical protein
MKTAVALSLLALAALGCFPELPPAPGDETGAGETEPTGPTCELYESRGVTWLIEDGWTTGAQTIDPDALADAVESGQWIPIGDSGCYSFKVGGNLACTIERECGLLIGLLAADLPLYGPGCDEIGLWSETMFFTGSPYCFGLVGDVAVLLDGAGPGGVPVP